MSRISQFIGTNAVGKSVRLRAFATKALTARRPSLLVGYTHPQTTCGSVLPKSHNGFYTPSLNPFPDQPNSDFLEACSLQIFLQLCRSRALRDMRRALARWKSLSMFLKHIPAFIRTEIDVIDKKTAARPQNTERLDDITIAVPLVQMHEDNCAID